MTISTKQMKDILSTAMQNNTNSNLQDAINSHYECSELIDGMVTYSVTGFECISFVPVDIALSSGIYNAVLEKEMLNYEDQYLNDTEHLIYGCTCHSNYFDEMYIDYWIEVMTEYKQNTIKAFVSSGNGKYELLSELVDNSSVEAFTAQCEKFVEIL